MCLRVLTLLEKVTGTTERQQRAILDKVYDLLDEELLTLAIKKGARGPQVEALLKRMKELYNVVDAEADLKQALKNATKAP